MSQHRSLKSSRAGKKLRSVLKRYETFFALRQKGVLQDDSSVFGMPKLKIVRTKIKKEKPEEKPEEVAAQTSEAETMPQKESIQRSEKPKKVEKEKKEK